MAINAANVPCGRTRWMQVRKVLREPSLIWPVLNARWQLLAAARAPLSVRVHGRVILSGSGETVIGERVRFRGTLTPVELVTMPGSRISIGDGTFVNYGTSIAACSSVSIGRDCQIGQYTVINDNDYHQIGEVAAMPPSAPVVLEDRVWLGARVIVLKGVRIGHDAVIGAGSVVTRDVPPRSLAAGMPARVVRQF